MPIIIIGAGPIGLYTAIKLKQQGVKKIQIFDPHANAYTRPGRLDADVFRHAEFGLGKAFWSQQSSGHIKELERHLYAIACDMNVAIEQKRFVRFHHDDKTPGVVVTNAEGHEFIVSAPYVLDCTGSKRVLVHHINSLLPTPHFTLTPATETPLKHHFIAYVRMSEADANTIDNADAKEQQSFDSMGPLPRCETLSQLHALGWNHFIMPSCIAYYVGKNKTCLYLETPPELPTSLHETWVNLVVKTYAPNAHYEQMPPSRKYTHKPRFYPFTVEHNSLNQFTFEGKRMGLPTVIALGDTQIDPNYTLGHGIHSGMQRTDAWLKTLDVIDGQIAYYSAEDHAFAVHEIISAHKRRLSQLVATQQQRLRQGMDVSKQQFRTALTLNLNNEQRQQFTELLDKINAHHLHADSTTLFNRHHNTQQELQLTSRQPELIGNDLNEIKIKLHELIPFFHDNQLSIKQKNQAIDMINHLAVSYKTLGNLFIKQSKLSHAVQSYEHGIGLLDALDPLDVNHLTFLTLYSNLIIALIKLQRPDEAIKTARHALKLIDTSVEEHAVLMEKIEFNLQKAKQTMIENATTVPSTLKII